MLYQLDRDTFNNIIKDGVSKKRERYEDFLKSVDLLDDMEPYERIKIADVIKSVYFKAGEVVIKEGDIAIDEVVVTLFKGPKSYTGEDVVEVSGHGSPYVLQQLMDAFIHGGARLAQRLRNNANRPWPAVATMFMWTSPVLSGTATSAQVRP